MKTIILSFDFKASHSLIFNETPHEHEWNIVIGISGDAVNGYLFNMLKFRSEMNLCISRLESTYLNENTFLTSTAKNTPNCEELTEFFWEKTNGILNNFKSENPSLILRYVEVALVENGIETVRVRLDN